MSLLPAQSQFGSYQIICHLASGGMAQIYLAKAKGLAGFEKRLVLKVINAEYATEDRFIQMLIDEAKITVGLSHINIGQIFDLGRVDDIYYIAMEYVDGVDVLELVNGLHNLGEKVPIEAVALIGRQICSGLHYAHTRKDKEGNPLNIVHRDISPQNILVSRSGEVKVVDFGIAKAAGVTARTQAGVIKGKVHYMAPEQALGQKADCRSDVFSTGIVLWEMLTAQMVYSGENLQKLLERVRQAKIPPPSLFRSEVPAALGQIVMKALAPKATDRFQDAHQFEVELAKFLSASASKFNSNDLADLVERLCTDKNQEQAPDALDLPVDNQDLIRDINSVIGERVNPADSIDQARILIETPQEKSIRFLEEELVLGRAGDLVLPDARVSRRHARIHKVGEGYAIEDLGSANGTFVNEQKISQPQLLADQDTIRIGACRMIFRAPELDETASRQLALPVAPATPAAPVTPVPRIASLVIQHGTTSQEQPLRLENTLSYTIQLGPARLEGVAARIAQRDEEFWLEPTPSRESMRLNGAAVSGPVRLNHGDTFTVGSFSCEFRHPPSG